VIFGEVLFDQFPDESSVLGGAPFNVAWHLQGFGLHPIFISRIGDDKLGKQVTKAMDEWGMDSSGLQIDAHHATGIVKVSIDDGQPSFDIVADQAYDHIDLEASLNALDGSDYSLIYHGSLIARSDSSRLALAGVRQQIQLPCFVDLNLRPPWCDTNWIEQTLKLSQWIKLNDLELAGMRNQPGLESDSQSLKREACKLQQELGVKMLILTRGANGALLVDHAGRLVEAKPVPVAHMADTVGAGDAFSAVMILGILRDWSKEACLSRASAFASSVCAMRGATGFDPTLYANHLAEWNGANE